MTQELTLSQKRAAAGRKGGRRTLKRYGKRHMKKLARLGGHVTRSLYRRVPVFQNDFAIVSRKTGEVVALLSGKPLDSLPLPRFFPDPVDDVDMVFR